MKRQKLVDIKKAILQELSEYGITDVDVNNVKSIGNHFYAHVWDDGWITVKDVYYINKGFIALESSKQKYHDSDGWVNR